ncbi:hypothetical protein HPB48_006863 [Haemaphysalis longicornis]|uniref:Uncharacterized protein n=1 Tax=Haemaphysalis longicornis TaxID=44386 RepID=A0A9J6FEE6_HAELO|nr:hypothetical protein HPB48_006863 [Haemaphysalis longicornis]
MGIPARHSSGPNGKRRAWMGEVPRLALAPAYKDYPLGLRAWQAAEESRFNDRAARVLVILMTSHARKDGGKLFPRVRDLPMGPQWSTQTTASSRRQRKKARVTSRDVLPMAVRAMQVRLLNSRPKTDQLNVL